MQEVNSFAPEVLKRRDYHDWNWGHRYILNLRPGDVYARNYRRIDKTSANDDYFSPEGYTSDVRYFVPNPHIQASTEKTATTVPAARTNGDPEIANPRYFIRGNGEWMLTAPVTEDFQKRAFSSVNLKFVKDKGLVVDKGGEAAEVVYHFSSANVMTSMWMTVNWAGAKPPTLSISVDRGATWLPVAQTSKDIVEKEAISTYLCTPPDVNKSLMAVNGRYQVLVKAVLAGDTAMSSLDVHLVTQLNTKTQPRLNIGKNTVYVGTGEQTDSIVYFPDLQSEKDKTLASAMENVKAFGAVGYAPAVSLAKGGTGSITFKMVAPDEITSLTYGAKMCTREKGSRVEFQHSFDGGDTWVTDYTQEENLPDPIHYVTVDKVPAGTKTVQYKYVLVGKATDGNQLGLSEVRMEADHKAPASKAPLAITFAWREVMPGGGLFDRAHTEKVTQLPHKYTINVGGLDHPQMVSLTVSAVGDADVTPGYSDRREGRAKKWEGRWVKYGTVLTLGKKYTVSVPSLDWRGGKDDGVRMTDGVIGPLYAGGNIPKWGMVWLAGSEPVITVDMEKEQDCGAFRFHMATWPWWDALKGQMQDKVEVLTSLDGKEYTSHGLFNLELRRKDVPINHMLPDEETAMGWVFEKLLEKPVKARFVQFKFTIVPVEGKSKDERKAVVTEVQALDKIEYEPFDLKITEPLWMK